MNRADTQLSVIVLIPDDSNSNDRTLAHLRAQTVSDRLEIVLVAPDNVAVNEQTTDFDQFNAVKIVRIRDMTSTPDARAAGVNAASAPLVALAEDHSFPEPDWAERLIAAHEGRWAAVGPAVGNANPRHALSWANLAIEYGLWMHPVTSGQAEHLPGHNSVYKRHVLLDYGDELSTMLEAESILQWDLRSRGHLLFLEANAKTFHLNYTLFGPSLLQRVLGGRLFAAARARKWTIWKRLFYGATSPLIPLRRAPRIINDLRRVGRLGQFAGQMAILLPLLLVCDAIGEMCGYCFGRRRAMIARISDMEFSRHRFMKSDEIALTTPHPDPVPAMAE